MLGKKLSPILNQIEETIWDFEMHNEGNPEFTLEGFRSSMKIFMCCLMDKMWKLQENENLDIEDRIKMAEKCGNDVRNIVKTYTNIDTHDLYI